MQSDSNEICENTADGKIKFNDNTVYDKSQTSWTYTSTGTQTPLTIPVSGVYEITIYGAQGGTGGTGGNSNASSTHYGSSGSTGTYGSGTKAQYYIAKGQSLTLYVGTQGANGSNGSNNDGKPGGSGGGGGAGKPTNGVTGSSGGKGESASLC